MEQSWLLLTWLFSQECKCGCSLPGTPFSWDVPRAPKDPGPGRLCISRSRVSILHVGGPGKVGSLGWGPGATVMDLIMILFVQKLLNFLLIQLNVHVYVGIWFSPPKPWFCGA